jgi:hypothetical protein
MAIVQLTNPAELTINLSPGTGGDAPAGSTVHLPAEITGNGITQPIAAASTTDTAGTATGSASQKVTTRPAAGYVVLALVELGLGFGGGLILQHHFHPGMTKLPAIPAGVGTVALLYIVAQAIERILVPVSWFGGGFLRGSSSVRGTRSQLAKDNQSATVEALKKQDETSAQTAANTQFALNQYKANLSATTFGLAALLAMLISGYTGLFLLAAVNLHVAGWLDLLVSGLAIAGGTKPLHDTINTLSSASKAKKTDISF